MKPAAMLKILGQAGVGKYSILRAIGVEGCKQAVPASYALNLDTKYYTATVQVCTALPSSSSTAEHSIALLLVFDASNEGSFVAVRSWLQAQTLDTTETVLLVANKADSLFREGVADRSGWLDDARLWCSELCYEYVETCCTDVAVDQILNVDGEDMGAKRVLQAIQAHTWPGLTLKTIIKPISSTVGSEAATAASASQNTLKAAKKPERLQGGTDELEAEEKECDEFEALMFEMQGARARLSQLPDSRRREEAAALALKLAAFMDVGDDDSEDDLKVQ